MQALEVCVHNGYALGVELMFLQAQRIVLGVDERLDRSKQPATLTQ